MSETMGAADIEEFLRGEVICRVGCHADGVTYVIPMTYVYDGTAMYSHSGEGMKITMMRKNPRVCVEVERLEGPRIWKSVIAWGNYRELHQDEALRAYDLLLDRLMPDTPAGQRPRFTEGIMYRIDFDEKTGRYEKP